MPLLRACLEPAVLSSRYTDDQMPLSPQIFENLKNYSSWIFFFLLERQIKQLVLGSCLLQIIHIFMY